jgi:hypothetical protein
MLCFSLSNSFNTLNLFVKFSPNLNNYNKNNTKQNSFSSIEESIGEREVDLDNDEKNENNKYKQRLRL